MMKTTLLKTALALSCVAAAAQASAQVTFFEHDGYAGRAFSTQRPVEDLSHYGFNDRASSVQVDSGQWEVCEDADFRGRCVVLRQGRYSSLSAMGLNDRISSVRAVSDAGYTPAPMGEYDGRRRPNERLYQARVVATHAVVGPPEQRCWVEREQVQERSPNVGGAIAGAVIGGILGHQVGGGSGRDLATVGGAVAGAAVGSRVNSQGSYGQDVQRCTTVRGQGRPEYWDVTYVYRGQEHHVQMTSPPGRYVTVNRQGEPRA